MSQAYAGLAQWYDALTGDVPYKAFADFYEKLLKREGKQTLTLLDLCCGTGTLTGVLAERGHEMIGVDMSPEMLSEAQEKAQSLSCRVMPMYLCQEACELDLYGTVEGALCSLDGMNYIPPEDIAEIFRRLHLFIEPGGRFAFDMHSPQHLHELDGQIFVDEDEDVLCLWRADFDEDMPAIVYGMDIFSKRGRLWDRESEEHVEYSHEPSYLEKLLESSGFTDVKLHPDCPQGKMGRLFITAKRKENG